MLARWEDPDYSVDPALVAARRSHAETLQSVLAQLPDGYRNALLLHDGQGLTAAELAEATGIPLGTAKSNIRGNLVEHRPAVPALVVDIRCFCDGVVFGVGTLQLHLPLGPSDPEAASLEKTGPVPGMPSSR